MRKDAWLPYLAFSFCALIWGSTFLVIRFSNDALPPLWGASLRLLLASAMLFLICAAMRIPLPKGPALKAAMGYGALNFGVSLGMLYWGETKIPSGLAAVLYPTAPIFAMLMARAFGLERLEPPRLAAGVIALGGVVMISWHEIRIGNSMAAIAAVLGSVLVAVCATMVLKRGPKQSALAANAIATLVGGPICFVFSAALREAHPLPIGVSQLWPVVYLTLAGSIGAFVTYSWLLGRWKATSTSFIAVIIPVIAVVLGALFRNERFAPASLAGAAIVIASTAFVLRSEAGAH